MAKIIVEVSSGLKQQPDYKIFDAGPVRIGRGFDNDVIISDPFVSGEHLELTIEDSHVRCRDLGSINGTVLLKTGQKITDSALSSGDELLLGRIRIRVYAAGHPIAPALALRPVNRVLKLMERRVFAWSAFFLLAFATFLELYLHTIDNDQLIALVPGFVGLAVVTFLWSGFWAFVGRLIRHKIYFTVHLSIFCAWSLANFIFSLFGSYTGFYFNAPLINTLIEFVLEGGLMVLAMSITLAYATHMSGKMRAISSTVFFLIMFFAGLGVQAAVRESNPYNGPYDAVLKPPVFGVPRAHSVEHFIGQSAGLYEFKK